MILIEVIKLDLLLIEIIKLSEQVILFDSKNYFLKII